MANRANQTQVVDSEYRKKVIYGIRQSIGKKGIEFEHMKDLLTLYHEERLNVPTYDRKFWWNVTDYIKREAHRKLLQTHKEQFYGMYYAVMLEESNDRLDSYCLYVERNRPVQEQFYLPRRKTLIKVVNELQALEDDELDEIFIHLPARTGKLVADDTPIMTKNGWKTHGELRVGDYVIGSDGKYTKVVAVHPKHHTTHTVTIADGTEIECHYNHEWTVFDKNKGKYRTIETKELIGNIKMKEGNNSRNRFYLLDRPVMQGEHKKLAVHPYVFGAWIGDGTTRNPCISEPRKDYAIFEKIQECGYEISNIAEHKETSVLTVGYKNLRKDLQEYNLCNVKDTDTKYIPDDYLQADVEQRLQLLAGLLDTDGHLKQDEGRYEFTTVYSSIKESIITLINSFGWRVSVYKTKPSKEHKISNGRMIQGKRDYYKISFNPTFYIPCVLERKQLLTFSKPKRLAITDIRESEHKQGNCITVENEDGIYLVTRNMIPTHNSQIVTMANAWHCSRNTELSNLYCTYKESLGGAFLDGVMEIITDPTYVHGEIFPNLTIAGTDAKAHKLWLNRKRKYATLSGKGLESGLNGEYDCNGWLTIDDILEGIQDVLNPETLHRKQIVFDNNLMKRKKEGAKVIYEGTIWSLKDMYMNRQEFLKNNPEAQGTRWKILRIPALDPITDESNFDYDYGVGFSTKYYRMERAKFEENDDMAGWFAQCQQEPIERDGAVFNHEHMKFYNGELPQEEPVRICTACDVALGGADYLSMPIAYIYEDGSCYIHDVVYSNEGKEITQPLVVDALMRNQCGSGFFESNAGGENYKDEVDRLLKDKGYKMNLISQYAPANKRKEQRIWDKVPEIRQFYFRSEGCRSPQYRKFMTNVYSFTMNGKNKNDDAPDSLAMLATFINGTGATATATAIQNPFRSRRY